MSNQIINEFNGTVPDNIDDLTKLSGIGRKTANLICGDIYGKPAIIADTHCIRLSGRLGLTKSEDPKKVEMDLKKVIPPEHQTKLCHNFVHHGRAVCSSRSPKCEGCLLSTVCLFYANKNKRNSKSADK